MSHTTHILAIILISLSVLAVLCGCTAAEPTSADPLPGTSAAITAETVFPTPDTESIPNQPPITTEAAETEATETAQITIETAEVTPPAQPTRITVPRLSGKSREDAEAALQDAGIPYTVTESYAREFAKDTVIKLQFYGKVDEETCYVNPNYPTELIVSLGTRWKTNAVAVDEKRIYLTFDDGPYHNTDRVLEILDAYDARATFFTLGMYAAVYPERIQAIHNGGHLLACHSYSHDYMKLYESAETVLGEIAAWETAIEEAGVPLPQKRYFRFPGGTTTYYMEKDRYEDIFWAVYDAGYFAMDWTCANNDRYLNGKTEEQTLEDYLLQSVITTVDSIDLTPSIPKIMLMHDVADETVAALPQILEYLLAEGYTFGTLDELDGYWVFQ